MRYRASGAQLYLVHDLDQAAMVMGAVHHGVVYREGRAKAKATVAQMMLEFSFVSRDGGGLERDPAIAQASHMSPPRIELIAKVSSKTQSRSHLAIC